VVLLLLFLPNGLMSIRDRVRMALGSRNG
jgi:hypothetical protein